jgi:hypothetical protein
MRSGRHLNHEALRGRSEGRESAVLERKERGRKD